MSVVLNHSRFSVATIKNQIKNQVAAYDMKDKENDCGATECLIATLNREFCSEMEQLVLDNHSFPILWMTPPGNFSANHAQCYPMIPICPRLNSSHLFSRQKKVPRSLLLALDSTELNVPLISLVDQTHCPSHGRK